jgi:NADH-quinone oxidoreductase subunit N
MLLAPELILVLFGTLIYVAGAFLPGRPGWGWLASAAILLAAVALYQEGMTPLVDEAMEHAAASGPITIDQFSTSLRYTILAAGLVFVMTAARFSEQDESSEFMGSLIMILAGLMLVSLATDLVLVFVGLELVSIPTYVLLYLGRGRSLLESGTKYFFLSVLSSALMLYGFSFLYGVTGSTNLHAIRDALAAPGPGTSGFGLLAELALVLVFAGLAFRLTAVPFHFYAPDVYQGTTNPNASLLAIVPKIAAVAALVRVTYVAMPGLERVGWQLALALALVTMTLGNLLALWQSNVRRLMAYSSVAHAGYLLIGLAVGFAAAGPATEVDHFDGVGAMLFYLLVYSAATAGTFAALTYLSSGQRPLNTVDQLAGLSGSHPMTAAAIAVFMFSLTGLPPLAGFWGKLTLFTSALGIDSRDPEAGGLWPWFVALAAVGALNAAISAAYYLRIVGVMYFRPASSQPQARGGPGAAFATLICALAVLGIGCYPGPFMERANQASRAVRPTLAAGAEKMRGAATSVPPSRSTAGRASVGQPPAIR